MTCGEWISHLVECARRGAEPDLELQRHLSLCAACQERWNAERRLSAQFDVLRERTAALRSPEARREELLRDFARQRDRYAAQQRRLRFRSWAWGLSAAAMLVLALFGGREAGLRTRHGKAVRGAHAATAQTAIYETSLPLSRDASALSSDDFIAIPYTPPLAPGEIVRMVRENLSAEALASMGVDVDPSWTGDLQADVVVGEDGLPRAVRITGNGQ